ncbi:folylpolyglutamate synthase [Cladophialophora yegresii CBS 114405]|uniref:tetrahydrofolate synthase n=1 Tax=Cladophialophora yegresii CBS 114405 TaxID=1182544 RepID=W9WB56_9EURO|nr:folylpolyglutamate synthase [Cladophialophora yegresii CBS 114405]EXJ65183.1 folylpolyglutamate synthase [Cladophialophora yegresii CBS 114405]
MSRTYNDAVTSLNTLQSNFAIVDAIRKSGRSLNEQAIPEMVDWCRRIGYKPSDFNALNAIHIAGTKGKGSTAAFTSSILTQFIDGDEPGFRPLSKVGLFTSPHLTSVRERIQINGEPLSEEVFAKYFFEVWDRLENAARDAGEDPASTKAKPVYFRYLTLMAFHTYLSEKVNVAVIECGIGGAYDSTNVLESPVVTAITSLGIDHVGMLGDTIGQIAWHKSGIMKKGIQCFTPDSQPQEAKEIMEKVAKEKECLLEYVKPMPKIETGDYILGLQGEFQKINATLALEVAWKWLRVEGYKSHDRQFFQRLKNGLRYVRWPGRCDTRKEKGIEWYVDGAHTLESIRLAGEWFASQVITKSRPTNKSSEYPHRRPRVLIFNQQTRDANAFAEELFTTLSKALDDSRPFSHVIFCTNTTFKETGFKPDLVFVNSNASDVKSLTVQRRLAEIWAKIDPAAEVGVVRTIEEAVEIVRKLARHHQYGTHENAEMVAPTGTRTKTSHTHEMNPSSAKETRTASGEEIKTSFDQEPGVTAFVTGSLHLVGGFLEVLESTKASDIANPDGVPTSAPDIPGRGIKSSFAKEPEVYSKFLAISEDFKNRVIDVPQLLRRVADLYIEHERPEVLMAVNLLLPNGYPFELAPEDSVNATRMAVPCPRLRSSVLEWAHKVDPNDVERDVGVPRDEEWMAEKPSNRGNKLPPHRWVEMEPATKRRRTS